MDSFCYLAQISSSVRQQASRHPFHYINLVFYPNYSTNSSQQELNSLKKTCKDNTAYTTWKKILGWIVNSLHYAIYLWSAQLTKVKIVNALFTLTQHHTSKDCWHHLLCTMHSRFFAIPFGADLFLPPPIGAVLSQTGPTHLTSALVF